jgi:hypothetical protein
MAITVIPPTEPPTTAPTFKLLPKETEIEEGRGGSEVKGKGSAEEVSVEEPVGVLGVAAVVAEPGLPINAPEAISGLSIQYNVGVKRPKKRPRGRCIPPVTIDLVVSQLFSSWRIVYC